MTSSRRKYGFVAGISSAILLAMAGSCSSPNGTDPGSGTKMPNGPGDCTTNPTGQGCPCGTAGESVDCGEIIRRSADYVICSMGKRTCTGGTWGTCEGDKIALHSVAPLTIGGLQLQGFPPTPCTDDPCNPACYTFDQDGGFDADPGFTQGEAGLTLLPQDGGCSGLTCQIVSCDGAQTTITGTVTDPAGQYPIYNAYVYIPNAPVQPFPNGVQADSCGGGGTLSGNPIIVTNSAVNGTFTLTGMVPAGANIPLVIQVGQWRREVLIPNVPQCATTNANTALGGAGALHLPTTKTDSNPTTAANIPQMAIVTGGCDAFDCLLKRIGVAPSEFTPHTGNGRVHMYHGAGGEQLSGGSAFMDYLFQSQAQINTYNIVALPCDCGNEFNANDYTQNFSATYPQAMNKLKTYADSGGRVFTSHWGLNWIWGNTSAASPWRGTANWYNGVGGTCGSYGCNPDPLNGYVDVGFPKGAAFAQWLGVVGATDPFGITPRRIDVASVVAPTQRWVYQFSDENPTVHPNACTAPTSGNNGNCVPDAVSNMSFLTPVGSVNQFGKVVFSDTHVSAADTNSPFQFPQLCSLATTLSAQEKALEFLFFDLSSCNIPIVVPPFSNPVSFSLDYNAQCPNNQKVVWRFFDWKAIAPLDSSIDFFAATADTQGNLGAATSVGIGTASVALVTANAMAPPPINWIGTDVSTKLPVKSGAWLRVKLTFNPSSNGVQAPTLSSWRQLYDCVDNL